MEHGPEDRARRTDPRDRAIDPWHTTVPARAFDDETILVDRIIDGSETERDDPGRAVSFVPTISRHESPPLLDDVSSGAGVLGHENRDRVNRMELRMTLVHRVEIEEAGDDGPTRTQE